MSDGGLWQPALSGWVDEVERHWAASGMAQPVRERLRLDLVADLARARAHGATVHELVGIDATRFATDLAAAEGIVLDTARQGLRPRPQAVQQRLVLAGLVGTILGALASWFAVFPLTNWYADTVLQPEHPDPWGFYLLGNVVSAALVIVSGGVAVRLAIRHAPHAGRLAITAAIALALSGMAAVIPTMLLASTTGFRSDPPIVVVEVLMVAAFCVAGLLATVAHARRRHLLPSSPRRSAYGAKAS